MYYLNVGIQLVYIYTHVYVYTSTHTHTHTHAHTRASVYAYSSRILDTVKVTYEGHSYKRRAFLYIEKDTHTRKVRRLFS